MLLLLLLLLPLPLRMEQSELIAAFAFLERLLARTSPVRAAATASKLIADHDNIHRHHHPRSGPDTGSQLRGGFPLVRRHVQQRRRCGARQLQIVRHSLLLRRRWQSLQAISFVLGGGSCQVASWLSRRIRIFGFARICCCQSRKTM